MAPPSKLQQSTLSFHKGRVGVNRPGPKAGKNPTKLTPALTTALTTGKPRRRVGGVNEAQVIEAFQSSRAYTAAGEPDSGNEDEYKSNSDHRSRARSKRNTYSREKKLLAIAYFEQTDMPRKVKGTWVPISESQASKKLKIDQHSLREWKQNKQKILAMKKGAKRYQRGSYRREHEIEVCLNKEFNMARVEGQEISGY